MQELVDILNEFPKKKIVVVGDVMLDISVYGGVRRISPEAPIPVFKHKREVYSPGGAGNVANNIDSLGGNVFLFGYTGKDSAREILLESLNRKNIKYQLYPVLEKTIQKKRFFVKNHLIFREDKEDYTEISKDIENQVIDEINLTNPDIIVASDYGKGGLSRNIFSKIKNFHKKIIVDPKPQNKDNYHGVYLITPNTEEGAEMARIKLQDPENVTDEEAENIIKKLQSQFNTSILLTRGKEGISLFKEGKGIHIPTRSRLVYDVTGAGDTVVAAISLGLASGLSLEYSALLANHAAGIVVDKAGTATVSRGELEEVIASEYKKIKSLAELERIREDYARKGKRVIWTNGCFDILHAGHADCLTKARSLGDCLIVGLNSDNSVRKSKGIRRPINPEAYRADVLSKLECISYITIFDELTAEKCLIRLKPDVYVKGGDYKLEGVEENRKKPIDKKEREIIESYGGKIIFIPIEKDISTTEIIEKIKNT